MFQVAAVIANLKHETWNLKLKKWTIVYSASESALWFWPQR